MNAIHTLMDEHRIIERTLDALDGYATALDRGGEVDREDLGRFVTFVRGYADRYHHGKEEAILFAQMAESGFSREAGPLAAMLAEHDLGRRLVGALAVLADGPWPLEVEDRRRAVDAARAYTRLLRAHILKEDHVLYPMAIHHLSPDAKGIVAESCTRFERAEADERARLLRLADELAERYTRAATASRTSAA
jgi:hemerythrin-like domain-containing protein